MFSQATLSTENYDALLKGWSTQTLQPDLIFHGGNSKYCAAVPERQYIMDTYGWTINDDIQDTDGDKISDCYDEDDDNDGTLDVDDAFPLDPTEDTDTDGDGIGNNADTDDDGDGQSDADEESCGSDPLDASSISDDYDQDGLPDCVDTDDDNDDVLDVDDAFPLDETEYIDSDNDGIGNNADEDDDNDGTPDTEDAFPLDPTEDTDTDGDGIGNNADEDDDNDGTPDTEDAFPLDPTEDTDTDGDGIGNNADEDDDNDGYPDTEEEEQGTDPLNPKEYPIYAVVPAEAFTPNGDGINDAWTIPYIDEYPNNVVKVYNRWGHVVFETRSYRNNWEGVYNDNRDKLPAGSYMYVIDLGDGSKPIQGWIYLNY